MSNKDIFENALDWLVPYGPDICMNAIEAIPPEIEPALKTVARVFKEYPCLLLSYFGRRILFEVYYCLSVRVRGIFNRLYCDGIYQ